MNMDQLNQLMNKTKAIQNWIEDQINKNNSTKNKNNKNNNNNNNQLQIQLKDNTWFEIDVAFTYVKIQYCLFNYKKIDTHVYPMSDEELSTAVLDIQHVSTWYKRDINMLLAPSQPQSQSQSEEKEKEKEEKQLKERNKLKKQYRQYLVR